MGTLFKLIADSALIAKDPDDYTECQVCGGAVPVYGAKGQLANPPDPQDPDGDIEVYAACAPCILSGRVDQLDQSIRATIRGACSNPGSARSAEAALNRTPMGVPLFMQGRDWPVCCDAPTEFLGSPPSFDALLAFTESSREWSHGLGAPSTDFAQTGPPEGLRDVSFFECTSCRLRYFIFQPT
ncbi:MAG: hypothetical protein Q8L48_11010 [Archangium sp.]|nr:hypothetical protein [Archangium sp.]